MDLPKLQGSYKHLEKLGKLKKTINNTKDMLHSVII